MINDEENIMGKRAKKGRSGRENNHSTTETA